MEVAVAAQISPAGPRAAGRFGCSLLSIGATTQGRFDLLGAHWDVMEERSAQFGSAIDRDRDWRLVAPVHLAETKEHAYADVQFGLAEWVDYFNRWPPSSPETDDSHELADDMNASGFAVIGTPDGVADQISG